jgi:hypothetical protein
VNFRIYELARGAGVKHYVWSGLDYLPGVGSFTNVRVLVYIAHAMLYRKVISIRNTVVVIMTVKPESLNSSNHNPLPKTQMTVMGSFGL